MKVTLMDDYLTDEIIVRKIADAAGICYNADVFNEPYEKKERRAKGCISKQHWHTMKHTHISFRIDGISRNCGRQLLRHYFVHPNEEDVAELELSQRYVTLQDTGYITPPSYSEYKKLVDRYHKLMEDSIQLYEDLRNAGVKKEDARYCLHESRETAMVLTGSLVAWGNFLNLRTHTSAQWEIREVAEEIKRQLVALSPTVYGSFV